MSTLKFEVSTLRLEVGGLRRDRRLLEGNYDSLKRDNRQRQVDIIRLQFRYLDIKEKYEQLRQENRVLQRQNSEFRADINELQTTCQDSQLIHSSSPETIDGAR